MGLRHVVVIGGVGLLEQSVELSGRSVQYTKGIERNVVVTASVGSPP